MRAKARAAAASTNLLWFEKFRRSTVIHSVCRYRHLWQLEGTREGSDQEGAGRGAQRRDFHSHGRALASNCTCICISHHDRAGLLQKKVELISARSDTVT